MKVPLIGCGTLALLWGVMFSCLGFGMMVDPAKGAKWTDGVGVGAFFGGAPLVMGVGLLAVGLVLHFRDRKVNQQLMWIATRDRFTIQEFADAHGMLPAAAEAHMLTLIQGPKAPRLVYHRQAREYFHRDRLREEARMVDRCGSCQSPQNVVLLAGESGSCSACGATL